MLPPRANPRYAPRAPRGQVNPLPKESLTKLLGPAVDPAGSSRRGGTLFGQTSLPVALSIFLPAPTKYLEQGVVIRPLLLPDLKLGAFVPFSQQSLLSGKNGGTDKEQLLLEKCLLKGETLSKFLLHEGTLIFWENISAKCLFFLWHFG